jgi:c-di-GMP-binding flagellar brake protein YcgR
MSDSIPFRPAEPGMPVNERRMRGRMRQQGVTCNLGVVVDLSAGGIRVLSSRKYSGQHEIRLQAQDEKMTLSAEVVWTHRAGFRRHFLGLKFINMQADDVRRLTTFGIAHRLRETG